MLSIHKRNPKKEVFILPNWSFPAIKCSWDLSAANSNLINPKSMLISQRIDDMAVPGYGIVFQPVLEWASKKKKIPKSIKDSRHCGPVRFLCT